MKTTKRRLAAVLLAVMLSVTAFSMPAFAYSQEPITDGTPAETTAPETGTASTDATAGKDSGSSTAALTPKGNLTLVDDVNTTDSNSKQFITLQSKNGNYFYLVIDRSGSKENVYFLNLVDESDLMALIDKDSSSNTVKTCTCTDKCTAGNVNTSCPVCKDDMSKCIGKEKPVETASSQAATSSEPAAASSSSSGKSGSVLMVVALLIVLAAAAVYGKDRWGLSVYDSNTALIDNYINPVIGQMEVRGITPRIADNYIAQLQKMPPVSTATRKARTATIPPKTIEKIVKLLRTAFKQAVRWEMTTRNPFENVLVPRTKYTKRDIWTAETIRDALDACKDSRLYVAINLSFACSCRLGEILGLTWDNVHITDDDIAKDDASIYIDKELARCSLKALEALNGADVIKIFEPINKKAITRVVLKKPKTDSSIRKIWLPRTLAYILRDWRKTQSDLKTFLGEEYEDNDLVVCLQDGRPCETRIIEEAFQHLKEDAGLPNVVFHSLRHSSTTYKLKLNHGDLKATQGDTGHAELDMITNVYAHILDEDRKVNAQKFEASFYADPNLHAPALHKNIPVPEEPPAPATLDIAVLIDQLRQNPDLAATLAKLVLEQKTVRP